MPTNEYIHKYNLMFMCIPHIVVFRIINEISATFQRQSAQCTGISVLLRVNYVRLLAEEPLLLQHKSISQICNTSKNQSDTEIKFA